MPISTTDAIRELREHRPELSRQIDRYAELVASLPEWLDVEEVVALTGWSRDWVWARASELEQDGKARKVAARGQGGSWVFARDAALNLPVKAA